MTMNHYDALIIGAGHNDLTLPFGHPSPKGEGNVCSLKLKKPPLFAGADVEKL